MKFLFSLSLLLIASLILASEVRAQACGYIYAKFYVVDANGKFVSTAKLLLLSGSDGTPIAFDDREMTMSEEEGAFKFAHGLCGSHHNVKLVVTDPAFDTFTGVVDLPLNSALPHHVFTIRLKRKRSHETSDIEVWGRVVGQAKDNRGNPLADVKVRLTDAEGRDVHTVSSESGIFFIIGRSGKYLLEAKAPNGDFVRYEDISLTPGPAIQDISITFNTNPNKRDKIRH